MQFGNRFGFLKRLGLGLSVMGFVALISGAAMAEKPKHLGSFKDWDAYAMVVNGKDLCFAVSSPKTKKPANVKRGEVWLIVTHRPAENIRNQFNLQIGYPFRSGSTATARIGGSKFSFFTEEEDGWIEKEKDETNMINAMRRGSKLVISGTSKRGTKTTDQYSLYGFSAAHKAISAACKV